MFALANLQKKTYIKHDKSCEFHKNEDAEKIQSYNEILTTFCTNKTVCRQGQYINQKAIEEFCEWKHFKTLLRALFDLNFTGITVSTPSPRPTTELALEKSSSEIVKR